MKSLYRKVFTEKRNPGCKGNTTKECNAVLKTILTDIATE